jgi:hypothetical protein
MGEPKVAGAPDVTLIATDLRQSDQRDDPDPARKSTPQLMT